ncbi:RED-like protein N-terminal region family protein [Acanthocheilonema viteae]
MEADLKELLGTSSSIGRNVPTGTLRNEDFRQLLTKKLVQTSGSANGGPQTQPTHSFSHRQAADSKRGHSSGVKTKKQKERSSMDGEDDIFGPSNLNEILKNYRDRAEERRKGIGKDDNIDDLHANNAYRAVPSDVRATADAAQRRKQAIQESKYLGGDMEHTHLVKGLDYSLLHKVRSEIAMREQKNDETLESQYNKDSQKGEPQSDNRMVRNIHRTVFQNELPACNELFRKGRMAYVVDLEEEDNDLPTTLLRSVHDCPATESTHDINTSNMLIQKLTQVLSYLRTDTQKKRKKVEGTNDEHAKIASQPIFDDQRDFTTPRNDRDRERRDRDRKRLKPSSYFDDREADRDRDRNRDRERNREYERARDRDRDRERRARDDERRGERREIVKLVENDAPPEKKKKVPMETEGYAECYPGGMYEAAGESDDEADYSKMDMGNRRGPVKRWDFDDHEDYEKYMESKEAMPKAAYQFGVKTNDGRKTRKSAPDREKHKLDREFSEITKILEKRKIDSHRSEIAKRIKY